jgi:hypothetical protein
VEAKASLVDVHPRPDQVHELLLLDDLSRPLGQHGEDIERAGAERYGQTILLEQPFAHVQAKGPEGDQAAALPRISPAAHGPAAS